MPYTPPSKRSPAASTTTSPKLSRLSSLADQDPLRPSSSRPEPSRSTTYLTRHRRTTSVKTATFPPLPRPTPPGTADKENDDTNSLTTKDSLRQSPPLAVTDNSQIVVGAIISPPDSAQNSSDDEDNKGSPGRQLENLAELQAAIRLIEQHRKSSPDRIAENITKANNILTLMTPSEAEKKSTAVYVGQSTVNPIRKIAHNRSNITDEDRSEGSRRNPPMIRKKRGELVKPTLRPSSARRRPSTMPETPTFSKAVHFDSHLEHVRHFLQVDRPLAGSSTVEVYDSDTEFPFNETPSPLFEWEIAVSNFPAETPIRLSLPVRVERVFLSADNKTLVGSVIVANYSFEKCVVVRFTLDYWKTTSEVVAEHDQDSRQPKHDGYDRFNFNIRLADQADLEAKTMFFCVKYSVNGQEYWDNNNSINFQVDFRKKPKHKNGKGIHGATSLPANSLPRSNKRPPPVSQRPKSIPVTFADFAEGFEAKYWVNDTKVLRPNPRKAINEEDSNIDNCSEISGASDSSSVPSIANMTDVKTSFSRDSGYVSIVSKTQRANPNNGEGEHDSARWESESVVSVQSLATMDTNSSVNPAVVGGAADELADTLIQDDSICYLIVEGYKNFDSDRFERNFRRMLKKFAFSLRKEAQNDLERSTVHLVYNYRAYVISLIRKRLALVEDERATIMDELPKQKASQLTLERYLEQFPGAEVVVSEDAGEENYSASDNDSDFSNDEQPSLPNLEKVKLYLLSSTAYSELKQQLTEFLRPSNIRTATLSRDGFPQAKLGIGTDDSDSKPDVGDGGLAMEICSFLNPPLQDSKREGYYPQSGSSSTQDVQFSRDAGYAMPQQITTDQSLEEYDLSRLRPVSEETSNYQNSPATASKTDYLQKSMIIGEEKEIPRSANEAAHLGSLEPKSGLEQALISSKIWVQFAISIKCTSQISLMLRNWWSRWRRKPVAKNNSRIEWKCPCGHDLYADFSTKSQDRLEKYAAILRTTPCNAGSDAGSNALQSSTNTLTQPLTAHLHSTNSSRIINQPKSQGASSVTPSCTLETTSYVNANNSSNVSFLELCVNTGAHVKTLGEIDLVNISTDGALFKAIKDQYLRLRGFRSRFWLLKPASVSFVRFSLENRHRVGILQKPLALPPKSEVDAKKWIYDPCPLEGDPPIAEDLFLHYLQCSEGSRTLFWMLRFPRKLQTSLVTAAGASTAFGWGVHIDEGPDFAALFMANFIVLLLSGVVALLWTLFKDDFQGAFGFACWIIAVLNSLFVAYMFKWQQE